MEKISVVVPIYNAEKYLNRCLNSLINQSYKNIEILLINDGSDDLSGYICDNAARNDDRIKVIHKKNTGVSDARNYGIDIATGEFICFIDSDDMLEEEALEYLYKILKKSNADVSCCGMKTYKNNILISNISSEEKISEYIEEDIIKNYSESGIFLYSVCNKLYSLKIIKNYRCRFLNQIRYAEDALFNFFVFKECKKVVLSNQRMYRYYINGSSTVNKVTTRRLDILNAQIEMYKFLKKNYCKYYENITKQFINSSIAILIDIARENTRIEHKELINKLMEIINSNKFILKNKIKVKNKEKFLFALLRINPYFFVYIYELRFKYRRNIDEKEI